MYNSKIYDYGKDVVFYFSENKVVASLCIVLEVAKTLHAAYIHKKCEVLELKQLDKTNKHRYIEIYNDSFSDMPHGTITDIDIDIDIDIDRVNKLLENEKTEYYYIVCDKDY